MSFPCPNAPINPRRLPRLAAVTRALSLAGALLATGCGEETPAVGDIPNWSGDGTDSGAPPADTDASSSETPWEWPDPVEPKPDAGPVVEPDGTPPPNNGSPSDAGTEQPIPLDDASVPPPAGGGKWTLKAGSAPDCPEEPPPIPLLGGVCFGVYWSCGWENEAGDQYSCVCDWIHYLCLPL